MDDDINRQLAKARALLEKSKAKVEEERERQELEQASATPPPTTTTTTTSEMEDLSVAENEEKKRGSVVNFTDEETGLITTDGELMALLSEDEDWEERSLLDVFDSELQESDVSNHLAQRDVAASIMNLRMKMHNDDYRKIFDSRNRWIGEDN
eukprot:CAMPEP_0197241338 /NCGR_PEP_ID=MMETSP1429-20130617/7395_1 /TAXON_ID=49237 /ORGANISM="Chaetoceros  sp., Strain UNC1202" /LENGTH=152 /DNA_ID=CAMNT_0042701155 /DNA_START=116 /DNA_END=574 /DNA_ORIENTATION=+